MFNIYGEEDQYIYIVSGGCDESGRLIKLDRLLLLLFY